MRRVPIVFTICIAAGWLLTGCQGHTRSSAATTPASGEKAAGRKVVLKELQAKGASKEDAAGIGAKLCTELAKQGKAELLCSADLQALFQHQTDLLTLGACEEQDCLAKLAERLQADFLVQGEVSKVGGSWVLTLQLVEGKTGAIKTRLNRQVDGSDSSKLLDEVGPLAKSLSESL